MERVTTVWSPPPIWPRRVAGCSCWRRRAQVGGAAVTEELFPGFRFSTCADGSGYLSSEVRRDLKLEANGLEILPADPIVFSPQPDGSHLTIWRDTARTAKEIEKFSRADAECYPAFVELISKIANVVGGLMRISPPDLPELGLKDLRSLIKLAGPARKLGRKNVNELLRVLPMPVADLLNEWFESDVLKGTIAASGVQNITWGPQEAGTAYTLLYNWALSDTGLFRSAGVVRGGMGALTRSIAESAKAFGAEIKTDAPVRSGDPRRGSRNRREAREWRCAEGQGDRLQRGSAYDLHTARRSAATECHPGETCSQHQVPGLCGPRTPGAARATGIRRTAVGGRSRLPGRAHPDCSDDDVSPTRARLRQVRRVLTTSVPRHPHPFAERSESRAERAARHVDHGEIRTLPAANR